MVWLRTYADVDAAFKSRNIVQGGGGRRDSHPFIGDSLLALSGDDHFERRRIESALFRRPTLQRLENDVLLPAFAAAIARCPRGPDGRRAGELHRLVRAALCQVTAALVGIDGVDTPDAADRYLALTEELALPVNMEWVTEDHLAVTRAGLAAKRSFAASYFRPSWERRRALLARAPDAAPLDLITTILRHPAHFGRWDDDLPLREVLLFNDGVFSIISGVIHTVRELIDWLGAHPDDRGRHDDREFLRSAAVESLRLHPASPFLIRRAARETVLPSGRVFAGGEYVVLDLVEASRDPSVFGRDAERFDPHRVPPQKVKRMGLAFGDGPHTCIGLALSMGEAFGPADREPAPQGLLIALVRAFFAAGGGIDPDVPQRWNGANVRNEYAEFPVAFARA
jgi:cytochrome P450